MYALLKSMQMKKNGIPQNVIPEFENILQTYSGEESDEKFLNAMKKLLTKEQRFRIFEQNGGCKGTGADKERKAFALKHADKPLAKRLELHWKDAVLNDDNTITVKFKCSHGYYKHAPKGKFSLPVETYFERCAGGRLYGLEKALGIKLRIKSVDVSPLSENISNPVEFTFEIVGQ